MPLATLDILHWIETLPPDAILDGPLLMARYRITRQNALVRLGKLYKWGCLRKVGRMTRATYQLNPRGRRYCDFGRATPE